MSVSYTHLDVYKRQVPVEIRKNNTMTVQFVDEQGQPIKHSAKGVNGLKEQDAVIITELNALPNVRPVIRKPAWYANWKSWASVVHLHTHLPFLLCTNAVM